MGIWQTVRRMIRRDAPPPRPPVAASVAEKEAAEEVAVVEMTAEVLAAALTQADPPLVLDIREPYEWRQVRMPGATHIPMNDIPAALGDLPRERPIVVVCSHGSRSYSVAGWLTEQGLTAASLQGGITQWARRGGRVEQGAP
jgi:rhodanese-related sulfurtransferase